MDELANNILDRFHANLNMNESILNFIERHKCSELGTEKFSYKILEISKNENNFFSIADQVTATNMTKIFRHIIVQYI